MSDAPKPVRCIIIEWHPEMGGEPVRLCQAHPAEIAGAVLLTTPSKTNCPGCMSRVQIVQSEPPDPDLHTVEMLPGGALLLDGAPLDPPASTAPASRCYVVGEAKPADPHPAPWRLKVGGQDVPLGSLAGVLTDANGEPLIGFANYASPDVRALTEAAPEMLALLRHADNTDADDSVADALDALIERNNGGDEDDLVRATVNVSAFLGKARAIFDRIDKAAKETQCEQR